MKVIIAGSRTIRLPGYTWQAIAQSGFAEEITEVVCGMAVGPDLAGKYWAKAHLPSIPVREFPAEWGRLGRMAGRARNWRMAEYAGAGGALVAVWDGQSGGTKHMIDCARRKGLKVFVWKVDLTRNPQPSYDSPAIAEAVKGKFV